MERLKLACVMMFMNKELKTMDAFIEGHSG